MPDLDELKRQLEREIEDGTLRSGQDIDDRAKAILGDEDYLASYSHVCDVLALYRGLIVERNGTGQWYHTIDLGGGELTDGIYDLRGLLGAYGFPASLKGKRVLEVGCADGFFSFHFEALGAEEVVAIDAFRHENFLHAHKKLGSKVQYELIDVMDLTPKELGYFDFVFCGTMLLHVSDPIHALKNIRNVLRRGLFVCASVVDQPKLRRRLFVRKHTDKCYAKLHPSGFGLGDVPTYWIPSVTGLEEMLKKAWFEDVSLHGRFTYSGHSRAAGKRMEFPHACYHCLVG